MVRGIETFREWFRGHEAQYAIIGGTACDLLMAEEGLDFRATKDIDLVLIVESVDAVFGKLFWDFVNAAGYEHRSKSSGVPQFYRFTNPKSRDFPAMIELFSRKPDMISLPADAILSPLPMDDDVSSLSAILLDDDYYTFLRQGRIQLAGVTVLDAPYLIPFKAKAWLDLSARKAAGEAIDGKNIRKHKNDVFRLAELLTPLPDPSLQIPPAVRADMQRFLEQLESEFVDLKQLSVLRPKSEILDHLRRYYG